MIDNFAFNSVLLCDVSLALHFKMLFCFMCSFLFFSCKYSFFISSLDFSNNIERFSCIIKRSKLIIFSMLIDNQLWRARVGIYNSNHLHHFTCLKINPANLDISIILRFSNFYIITVYLILLTYLSVYLFWTQLHNYGFNNKTINFANVLIFKYFDFCSCALNLKHMLLLESGDMETNVGPRKSFIKFCHWNLNGRAAHDFVKMSLIEPFIKTHNFNFICLSETFLDSSTGISDVRININSYSLLRADHPSYTKLSTTKTIYLLSRELTCLIFKNV